ncbi:MAG TPA: hypothetical protein PK718_04260 [Candidatus Methanofastidiosa archaeon]|nr:hypothetical protein [Candidatus Methanofastidiosa archaeon]
MENDRMIITLFSLLAIANLAMAAYYAFSGRAFSLETMLHIAIFLCLLCATWYYNRDGHIYI